MGSMLESLFEGGRVYVGRSWAWGGGGGRGEGTLLLHCIIVVLYLLNYGYTAQLLH